MNRFVPGVCCLACALLLAAGPAGAAAGASTPPDGIRAALESFRRPADSTRTKVWWFHGETPTTREGITADLEAFKAAGVGGVVYYDQVHGPAEGALEAFSTQWWEMLKFAALEARRIGLSFEINLSNGYVAGGPWITPALGMQRLCSSDTLVQGGRRFSGRLAAPSAQEGWRDVALLAFPVDPALWQDRPWTGGVLDCGAPFTLRSVTYTAPKGAKSRNGAMNYPDGPRATFYGMMYYDPDPAGTLEASDDGVAWRTVCVLPTPGGSPGLAQRTLALAPVTARYFRIVTGKNLRDVVLSSRAREDRWEEKAAYFSEFYTGDATPAYAEGAVDPASVVDLTDRLRPDGTLVWDAPEGHWMVLRIASEPTRGATKHGRRNLMGLECDKMSKEAVRLHFNSYAKRILDTLGRIGAKPLGVCMDSHEAGPQNWTPGFGQIFRERNGYDILPWLPAMRGCIVGSREATDRFLYDLRRTIAAAITENYYGELERLCRAEGVEFTAQAAGNGLSLVTDNILVKSAVRKPQTEFWARDIHGSFDIIEGSSAAHIYGRPIASAEAFTDAKYSDSPATLKMLADFAYTRLINEFVVCASAYQPALDEVPGNVAAGRQYCLNRNNTIWPYSRSFWDYQARCAGMLRRGEPVVDLLVYLGDDPPLKALAHRLPVIPEGYNFDVTSAGALADARVEDGTLVLRSGMRYRMLVIERDLRPDDALRPVFARWRAAGLPVFEAAGVYDKVPVPFAPDLGFRSGASLKDCVRFGHRRLSDADVYFVYNHSARAFGQDVTVRSPYRRLYRLDPLDGSLSPLPAGVQDGLLRTRIRLEPDESLFLVATDASLSPGDVRWPDPAGRESCRALDGKWTVRFDPTRGGPDKRVVFKDLHDWTKDPDPRIRYYSGTAVYSRRFRWHPEPSSRQYLRLDGLEWMARVVINGRDAGTVWCSPWRLDITDYLRPGRNEIRLEVTNSLYNRMIGDAVEHPDGKGAWTRSSHPLVDTETPLVPSGLRGAVIVSVSLR